uniref:Uncharacterized protein n=1 Tax=Aegilops tauschii TaxID=37682 RepID=M8AX17_AEGTA
MGRRFPAAALAAAVRPYARFSPAASKAAKPPTAPLDTPRNAGPGAAAGASSGRAEVRDVAAACGMQEDDRVPLAEVVLDCTKRWFQDTLKEARAGDAAMQVLVGQMYRSGYGVNKNEHKGTMLVTQIQMMLRKQANNGYFRVMGLLAGFQEV